jgi:hypothetical protein
MYAVAVYFKALLCLLNNTIKHRTVISLNQTHTSTLSLSLSLTHTHTLTLTHTQALSHTHIVHSHTR